MSKEHLINFRDRTPEERKKIASLGGLASSKKRRELKTVAEALLGILAQPVSKEDKTLKIDAIMERALMRLFENPTMSDVKILTDILGQLKQKQPNITQLLDEED